MAIGVVGLVENMVSGNAQRPGDIVKSYSGQNNRNIKYRCRR